MRRLAAIILVSAAACHPQVSPQPYTGQLDWTVETTRFNSIPAVFEDDGFALNGQLFHPEAPTTLPQLRRISGTSWGAAYSSQDHTCGSITVNSAEISKDNHILDVSLQISTTLCGHWMMSGRLAR